MGVEVQQSLGKVKAVVGLSSERVAVRGPEGGSFGVVTASEVLHVDPGAYLNRLDQGGWSSASTSRSDPVSSRKIGQALPDYSKLMRQAILAVSLHLMESPSSSDYFP